MACHVRSQFGAVPSPIAAQQAGSVGLIFQTPVATGIIWHVSDDVAIRPEASYSSSSSSSSGVSSTTTQWSIGVNAPFYMKSRDNIRAYLSPRLNYARSGTSTAYLTTWNAAGSFGAQYAPNKRLNIYGETGLGFTTAKSAASSVSIHQWAPRSAVGLILYLGR